MSVRRRPEPPKAEIGEIQMRTAVFVFLDGLLAALAVGLGAIGAHALKTQLTLEQLETYHTAVEYQMIHAIGLVGLLGLCHRSRLFNVAGWAMLVGIILFSGFLFAWLATGRKFFVCPVPVGGVAFIIGWLVLAIGALGLWKRK
jgi:uncharacterized membrane protein YgdD (TMEM256/DUF423 family)